MTGRLNACRTAPKGLLALAVGYQWIYNGVNFLAFKVSVDALPALMVGTLRFAAAGLLLLPFAAWRLRRGAPPSARQLAAAGLIGVMMLVAGQTMAIWGVQYLPAGVASVFSSASPLFLALFAWALLRQPLRGRQLAGVGTGFAGLLLMGWSAAGQEDFQLIGAVAVLAATAAWAGGSLLANRLSLPEDPVINLTAQLLPAAALLVLFSLASGAAVSVELGDVPNRAWGALAFLIIASTLIGYAAFIWVNKYASSTLANTFSYVAPVIAMGLAALFLNEPLSWTKMAAAGVALAGVALMLTR